MCTCQSYLIIPRYCFWYPTPKFFYLFICIHGHPVSKSFVLKANPLNRRINVRKRKHVFVCERNARSADLKRSCVFYVDNFKLSFRVERSMPATRYSIILWIQWRAIDTECLFDLEIGFVVCTTIDFLINSKSWIKLSKALDLKVEKDRSILFKTDKSIFRSILIGIFYKRNAIVDMVKVSGKFNDSKDNKVKSWRLDDGYQERQRQ